jgi:hypothetical protein
VERINKGRERKRLSKKKKYIYIYIYSKSDHGSWGSTRGGCP